MTWLDRINNLLLNTPADQIDDSQFWLQQLESAFAVAPSPDNINFIDALQFMYFGAKTLNELGDVFEPELIRAIFLSHVKQWNASHSIKLKPHNHDSH